MAESDCVWIAARPDASELIAGRGDGDKDDRRRCSNRRHGGEDEDEDEDDEELEGVEFGAAMGQGWVIVNAVPNATATFSADIEVKLKKAAPNTTYTLQRAPEVGRPLATDGICQRASGEWPWEQPSSAGFPPAPAFLTFVLPATGMPVTITTNGGGNGKVRFHFDAPVLARGARPSMSSSAPSTWRAWLARSIRTAFRSRRSK